MKEYSSIEEFKKDTLEKTLNFDIFSKHKAAYESLKKIIDENIITKPPASRRFSMVVYGSHGIGKSFVMLYVLKKLEEEKKLRREDYLICDNFTEEVTKEHDRLLYKYYNIKTINALVEHILKIYLDERDLKLVIFDNLKERDFLNIDFTALNFKYNSNGKGVIWILSFKEGFMSNIDKSNIELLEIPDITRYELQMIKDRYFRGFNVNLKGDINNIHDFLKIIDRKIK